MMERNEIYNYKSYLLIFLSSSSPMYGNLAGLSHKQEKGTEKVIPHPFYFYYFLPTYQSSPVLSVLVHPFVIYCFILAAAVSSS